MFNVEFWSFTKAPNSTAQPTGTSAVFKCVSNEDFNIIEPRIPLQLGPASNPTSYNYAKITVFNRYYWVTRWAFEGGLWVAYMRVDALASWKTDIGNMSAYVLRSAAAWDGDIIDNMYPYKADVTVTMDAKSTSWWDINPANGCYCVGIAGSDSVNYYMFTSTQFTTYLHYITSYMYAEDVFGVSWLLIPEDARANLRPLQYVTSVIWLPYMLMSGSPDVNAIRTGPVDVKLEYPEGSGTYINYAYKIHGGLYDYDSVTFHTSYTIQRHPLAATRGSWLNTSAASYHVYVPPFGNVQLPPRAVASHDNLITQIRIDSRTGNGILQVFVSDTGSTDMYMVARAQAMVGQPISIASTMQYGLGLTDILRDAASVASAGISAMYTGNVAGLIGAAAGAIGNAISADTPQLQSMGGVANVAALGGLEHVYYEWSIPVDDNLSDKGRPLCEIRQLSTLSGYQLCADVEVEIPCTRDEEQMIKGILESGYFYE